MFGSGKLQSAVGRHWQGYLAAPLLPPTSASKALQASPARTSLASQLCQSSWRGQKMDQILHRDVGFRGAICRGGGQGPGSYCTKVTLSPFSLLPCVHWRANSGCSKPLGTILHGEQGPVLKVGLIVCWFVQGIKKNLFIGNCDQKIILKCVNYYKFCPRTYPNVL